MRQTKRDISGKFNAKSCKCHIRCKRCKCFLLTMNCQNGMTRRERREEIIARLFFTLTEHVNKESQH